MSGFLPIWPFKVMANSIHHQISNFKHHTGMFRLNHSLIALATAMLIAGNASATELHVFDFSNSSSNVVQALDGEASESYTSVGDDYDVTLDAEAFLGVMAFSEDDSTFTVDSGMALLFTFSVSESVSINIHDLSLDFFPENTPLGGSPMIADIMVAGSAQSSISGLDISNGILYMISERNDDTQSLHLVVPNLQNNWHGLESITLAVGNSSPSAVPEPTAVALFFAGIILVGTVRLRMFR